MSDVLTRITSALESRYSISRQIGIGGMATVFLAHDERHDRDVAIKVLHPDLAAALGAERFLAEIKTTAKLQHPHILPLLDSGEADGLLYYVMPYVAGESLRARLDRETQLAVDDAVRIAREVASALDYAHRQGVVHRDIKPENILIHEDQALVADFGIALAVSAAGGPRMTQTGLSLGTPQYMSPEQAMGERAVDARADIYALGAVTYEMLVGEPPFTGPTVQAIVARVMTESPRPVTGQRRSVPANVNAAVLRALEKLPADRFHTAAEFSNALTTSSFASQSESKATTAERSLRERRTAIQILPWTVAGVAVVAAIAFALRQSGPAASTEPIHVAMDLPAEANIPFGMTQSIAIAHDGSAVAIGVAMGGRSYLITRRLGDDEFRIVDGSLGNRGGAVFSPDGKWLAFESDTAVFRAPTKGGPPTQITTSAWTQMTWTNDNSLVYTKDYDSGLSRVSFDGKDTLTLTAPDRKKGELGHWWPQLLPDGDHILFTNFTTPADRSQIEVVSLKTKQRKVVFQGGYFGRYAHGHLLFVRDAGVMSIPFDASAMKTHGTESPVPMDVEIEPPDGWAAFDVSDNGTLVYLTDATKGIQLTWEDAAGNEEPAVDSVGKYNSARVSPDGKKIAIVKDGDIWVIDRIRKIATRLTRTPQREVALVWTPDSREIIYSRDIPQYEMYKQAADGSGQEQLVFSSRNDKEAMSMSPDGRTLLFQEKGPNGDDIFSIDISKGTSSPRQAVISAQGIQKEAQFSPDGKWIAYSSNETGRRDVFVTPYPVNRGQARQQVSTAGGESPEWSPDGRSIYYSLSGVIRRVPFNSATGEIGNEEMLKRITQPLWWTVAPDGRFLVMRTADKFQRRSVKVILNWVQTLDSQN